ncbi:hypothetical protein G3M48_002887 [Beauveria asiatica]|uniref:Trichodiene synthase n=1 Tax=Beauveria asiatica TaxID=1069075 RepID=A0AAW0S6X2_9HYPO
MDVQHYRSILLSFLERVEYSSVNPDCDEWFHNEVKSRTMDVPGWEPEWTLYTGYAAEFVRTLFPHVDREAQARFAVMTALGTKLDDSAGSFTADLCLRAREVREGKEPSSPLVKEYLALPASLDAWYPTYSVNMMWKAVYEYIAFVPVEEEHGRLLVQNSVQVLTDYIRRITTAGDLFSYMLFPKEIPVSEYICIVPHLNLFLAEVNDLLSFYREVIVGNESNGVLLQRSKANGWSLRDAVKNCSERCLKIVEYIRSADLSHKVRPIVDEFVLAYITFHLRTPRYRLSELQIIPAQPTNKSEPTSSGG